MKRHEIGGALVHWRRIGQTCGLSFAVAEFECPGIVSKETRSYVEIKPTANEAANGDFFNAMEIGYLVYMLLKASRVLLVRPQVEDRTDEATRGS